MVLFMHLNAVFLSYSVYSTWETASCGHCCFAGQASDGEGGWTYEYVPGAGDDEESWARGLIPSLLYTHQEVSPPLSRL